jgi:hypothetical protein
MDNRLVCLITTIVLLYLISNPLDNEIALRAAGWDIHLLLFCLSRVQKTACGSSSPAPFSILTYMNGRVSSESSRDGSF